MSFENNLGEFVDKKKYDIAIIGAGPGGYHSAIRAAQYGAKVALIEKDKLGGTCLNRGCIPTKAFFASANLLEKVHKAKDFGIKIREFELNFKNVVDRKNRIVKELSEGIALLEQAWNNDIYYGHARILSGNIDNGFEILIEGKTIRKIKAERIIIATGSSPFLIPEFNIDHKKIITSDDVLSPEFNIIPKRLLIIGAGVIGCELAYIFSSFGSNVEMIEMQSSPIETEEPLIIKELQKKFASLDIGINTSQKVRSIEIIDSGIRVITAHTSIPTEEIKETDKIIFEADLCLVSIGRRKESRDLGLEELGITTERGAIIVDPLSLETSIRGIYAIGDVTGGIMLAHVASYEGKVAVLNALHSIGGFSVKPVQANYDVVPSTIFISPNIGSVGLRRKEAKNLGIDLLIGQFPYQSLGKAKCMGEDEGFIMILANKETEQIIGASCIGAEAPELISELALAIQNGLTIEEVANTIHSHPTISEMVLEAVEAAIGECIHKKGRPIHIKPKVKEVVTVDNRVRDHAKI